MDEPRAYVIPLAIWTVFAGALITHWSGLHPFAAVAWVLWLVLAMIALLAQTSARGREYLRRTLGTTHYTPLYRSVARPLNDWVWRRVGRMRLLPDGTEAPPPETTAIWPLLRAALTWRLLDRALLIAVAYPVIALILPWLLGGDAVLGARVVVLPAAELWPNSAVAVGLFIILTAGLVGQKLTSEGSKPVISILNWMVPLAAFSLLASTFTFTFTFTFAVVTTVIVAFAFTGASAIVVTFGGALNIAIFVGTFWISAKTAFSGEFTFEVAIKIVLAAAVILFGTLLILAAVTVVVAFAVDWLWSRGRREWALALVGGFWALGLLAVVQFVDLQKLATDQKAILVFVAILPVINGLFDALSYAITLALSRRGLATRWAPLWGLADLALGAVLFLALGATMAAVIAVLNALGTAPLYDLAALFAGLRASPGDYWWLYLILFSTLAPTALHLLIAALAVQGWFLFQTPRRAVAGWIAAAPTSHPAAVGGSLGQTMIWWLPLMALAVFGWVVWQFIGTAAGAAGLIYLDALEGLSRWIGAI